MLHMIRSLVCAYLSVSVAAANTIGGNIWLPNFTNLWWTTSAVTSNGKYLYIDSGEIWNGFTLDPYSGHVLASTIAIDLTKSWSNSTLPVTHHANKPEQFPFSRKPLFWYDDANQAIFSYGGAQYYESCLAPCLTWKYDGSPGGRFSSSPGTPDAATPLWQLSLDDDGAPAVSWQPSVHDHQPSINLPYTFGGLSTTTTQGDIWVLGGLPLPPDGAAQYSLSGLVHFNGTRWTDRNIAPPQYATLGGAAVLPSFSSQGVIIFWGGYLSNEPFKEDGSFAPKNLIRSMSSVSIFDIASNQYFQQDVSGSRPPPRHTFCYVSVADGQGNADIFMYGGEDQFNNTLGDIWVLSIPSFHWTQVLNPEAIAPKKTEHTCSVIGQRQMVSIGGINGKGPDKSFAHQPDPFQNGIGVFDMSLFAWVSRYNAKAKPYERHSSLAKSLRSIPYPSHWTQKGTAELFGMHDNDSSGQSSGHSSGHSSSHSHSEASSLTGGAIAGIVIGAIAAVVIIAVVILFFLRRRRRTTKIQQQEHKPLSEEKQVQGPAQNGYGSHARYHPSQPYEYYAQEGKELPRDYLPAVAQMPDDEARGELLPTQGPLWEMRTKRDTVLTPAESGSEGSGSTTVANSATMPPAQLSLPRIHELP